MFGVVVVANSHAADGLEEMYEAAHAKIREDPNLPDPEAGDRKPVEYWKEESKKYMAKKLTHEERKKRVQAKIAELTSQ